ncbi:methionine/alanine import family NSS transporter small subunit [Frederiksenia canicola]|uniref:Methionine/alanine importer small subunit n=1 Tax=Frederiksenia canicola TaxID=123824 RepID=A0ABX9XTL3_9PAST|nr:methionine/alanine import family NSS transporter small subunit [Frederiksenia canicola]RPE93670.1 putative methionine/alanine importer small subunit [Frederiksenia canicola]
MSGGAILMMSASLIIIWGGLLIAVANLPKE